MSQRRAVLDRFGQPIAGEEKPVTREQIVAAINQLREEMNALMRFNDVFHEVMEEKYPGVMAEVIRRIKEQMAPETRDALTQ